MQTLNYLETVAAARWAYEGALLSAQAPAELAACVYSLDAGPGFPCFHCAIGSVLTADTLSKVSKGRRNTMNVEQLETNDIVDIEFGHRNRLSTLQQAHDRWARAVGSLATLQGDLAHLEAISKHTYDEHYQTIALYLEVENDIRRATEERSRAHAAFVRMIYPVAPDHEHDSTVDPHDD